MQEVILRNELLFLQLVPFKLILSEMRIYKIPNWKMNQSWF